MSEEKAIKKQKQPAGNGEDVTAKVIEDLKLRSKIGKDKYGTILRTNNGRDALVDAYQEALDLAAYLKQELIEREQTMS